jgi:surface protein
MDFLNELPYDVGRHIVGFLDVPTLVKKKTVCHSWRSLFTSTIEQKALMPQAFESGTELRLAIIKYEKFNPNDAEDFATTYGWPVGRWNVSNIEDFESVFEDRENFNENIGSWNVSNATSMTCMFHEALSFNQDISSWDTSNVTNMDMMFFHASAFNQDISSWVTSNVTDMQRMFEGAWSFHQDISRWDTSNVIPVFDERVYMYTDDYM